MEGEIKIEGDIDLPIGDQGGPELREVVVEGRELRVLLLEHIGDGPIAKLGSRCASHSPDLLSSPAK